MYNLTFNFLTVTLVSQINVKGHEKKGNDQQVIEEVLTF